MLTHPEFNALKREWERARGITPPITKEQQENLERNKKFLLEMQIAAYNRKEQKRLARMSKLKIVEKPKIPERMEA